MSDTYGEYYNPEQSRRDHDAIARLDGRLSVLERFTGVDGVNGMMQQFRDMKIDIDGKFEQVYTKLDAMEQKRDDAMKWRIGTIIAALSSIATLGMLIYMMVGG